MLVLSRRLNEKIVFPSIQAAVKVLAIKAGMVRLGIEAPPEVTVLREELSDRAAEWGPAHPSPARSSAPDKLPQVRRLLRNRLNINTIGLALLRRQLQEGRLEDAQATLDKLREDFQLLQERVDVELAKPAPQPPAKLRRALLVEDDHNECELLAGFLRLAGLDVTTAGDGADALNCLRTQGPPDVMLLDMVLPRCDGPTTVREIRRDPAYAGLKIYAVTGHTRDRFDVASGSAGVDRWFQKPVNPEALLRDLSAELDAPVACT
ncbi:MAG TPA: response regulator [Gemmataceae bacterium]|jgi:carbon storage regulator CsrA|nr:response regulator [Gemmataceae bacterium]